MSPTSFDELLARAVERFERELRLLANELARGVLAAELRRASVVASNAPTRRKRGQVRNASTPRAKAMPTSTNPPAPSPSQPRSAREWTREDVVAELGQWLITSKAVDMAFLKRHGPRGLVDAAKRIFGRFDAALNAANLAIAPRLEQRRDGAVSARAWPSMRELAQRQRAHRADRL